MGQRPLFAVLFLGLACSTLAWVWPELLHLASALAAPYHSGTPPSVLAGAVAVAGALWVLVGLLRRRGPHGSLGLLLGAGFVLGLVDGGEAGSQRTFSSANLAILEAGTALHARMLTVVQKENAIPQDLTRWKEALASAVLETRFPTSPVRRRNFEPVPYALMQIKREGDVPDGLVPGTFLLWLPSEGERYELTLVGFEPDGEAALLRDEAHQVVALTGSYSAQPLSLTPLHGDR
ncbi:MAG: hypothetical protein ACOZIN_16450 [Myxococcota bacterium]